MIAMIVYLDVDVTMQLYGALNLLCTRSFIFDERRVEYNEEKGRERREM